MHIRDIYIFIYFILDVECQLNFNREQTLTLD